MRCKCLINLFAQHNIVSGQVTSLLVSCAATYPAYCVCTKLHLHQSCACRLKQSQWTQPQPQHIHSVQTNCSAGAPRIRRKQLSTALSKGHPLILQTMSIHRQTMSKSKTCVCPGSARTTISTLANPFPWLGVLSAAQSPVCSVP